MNSFEWQDHTADIKLIVHGDTAQDLFQQSLLGLYEFLGPVKNEHAAEVVNLDLHGRDMAQLLVDFLSSVVTWSSINKAYYHSLQIRELTETHFVGVLTGHCVDEFTDDIKAVTHHDARAECVGGEWQGTIIFDI